MYKKIYISNKRWTFYSSKNPEKISVSILFNTDNKKYFWSSKSPY